MGTLTTRRHFLTNSAALSGIAFSRMARATQVEQAPRSIHPFPNKLTWGKEILTLSRKIILKVAHGCDAGVIEMMQNLWQCFTFGELTLEVTRDAGLKEGEFSLAAGTPPQRDTRATYALTVNSSGIAASAANASAMRHAWFTLLQLLDADDATAGGLAFAVPHVEIQDQPAMSFRGVHLCVFRETPPHMIERAIRLAAFFKFTHIVLEFWGMLKLDSLKELAWPEAWSKEDASRLVTIARGMGLEVIPMFNSWGHATGSRIKYGRHVVLDQNPRLAPLFEPDGWTWCLTNPRSLGLLRLVHDELMEFTGPGQYFHIGCDEAYSHATCDRCRATDGVQLFADHINTLAAHIEQRGRRILMWGDALLERAKWPRGFAANGTPALPTHLAIDRISRKVIINDWHYDVRGEIPTLAHFREHGFETIACPWNSGANIRALAKAAIANQSAGMLMTTWHHLVQSIAVLHITAACMWSAGQAALALRQAEGSLANAATASLLRKLVPAQGNFDRAGWNPFEVPQEND